MKKFIYNIILILIFSAKIAFSQEQNYKFEHISVNEGLSHDIVYAIAQDNSGLLWIGTGDGMNKYNGITITKYYHDPNNQNSLASSNFGKILVENDSILWIGTYGGGLNKFNKYTNSFTKFENIPGDLNSLSDNSIEYIFKDSKNNIWLGTASGGLNKMIVNEGKITFKQYLNDENNINSLSNNRARVICEDNEGNIWIGTSNGLNKFNPETEIFTVYKNNADDENSLSSNKVQSLYFDENNILWIGTRGGGLNKLDIKSEQFTVFINNENNLNTISDNNVEFIYQDSFGILWLGTYSGGLNMFNKKTELFTSFKYDSSNPNSLSNNRVEYIFEDASHILWVGTRGGGLNKLDLKPKKFNTIDYNPDIEDELPNPNIFAITSGKKNVFWIGTDGGGLVAYNKEENSYSQFNTSNSNLASDRVWSLLLDKSGNIWAGTYQGGITIFRFDKNKYNSFSIDISSEKESSLDGKTINAIYQLNDGKILAGTKNKLLVIDSIDNKINTTKILENFNINAIIQDNDENIWIGTTVGLYLFDKNLKQISVFKYNQNDSTSISSNEIFTFFIDDKSNLWIGTKGGGLNLYVKSTKKFIHYFENDGLANNVVTAIEQDNNGNLWISTNYGLSKFDIKTLKFRNYNLIHGLSSPGFNHNSVYKTTEGELYFGSIDGITYFFPEKVLDNTEIPRIIIADFKIFSSSVFDSIESDLYKNLVYNNYIELNYKQNVFSFDFAALDYTNPESNNYAYMMEGFDNDWNYVQNRHYVMYTNLPHGDYTFKIKASNSDNIWNEQGLEIKIKIKPPFWKTWFFRIFTILFVVISAYLFFKFRIRRIEKQNTKLELIVRKRTAEVEQQKEEIITQSEHLQTVHEELLTQTRIIEIQNQNFTASISYAKTIQDAILPSFEQLDKYFETFIIFKPKDIVSGDFYWFTQFEEDNIIDFFFVVADCTGHGVPGAFMSMIGSRLLDEIIHQHKIFSPNEILTELNFKLRKALRQDQTDNRDGMDLIVCKINIIPGYKKILTYSGAKLPLYIASEDHFIKLDADRRTIGGVVPRNNVIFTNQQFELKTNDILYLATDGLSDQSNSERKRFGTNHLINILRNFYNKPLSEQEKILIQELNKWMADVMQRDDITLLAIKI